MARGEWRRVERLEVELLSGSWAEVWDGGPNGWFWSARGAGGDFVGYNDLSDHRLDSEEIAKGDLEKWARDNGLWPTSPSFHG